MNKQIPILGTKYLFLTDTGTTKELENDGLDGYTEVYTKTIKVREKDKMLGEKDLEFAKQSRYRETVRHEIIHAFFHEAGLEKYCEDELLVDYLAKQWGKMTVAFQEALDEDNCTYTPIQPQAE